MVADAPRDDGGWTLAAGLGVLVAALGLTVDFRLLVAISLGSALGGSASSGATVLIVTVAVVLIGAAAGVSGVIGGRRGRRLGSLWAVLAVMLTGIGLLALYGILTSPALTWPW